MAGRRRKNTVAGSKKESPKTQNTLQETNVSTDKEEQKLMLKSRQKMLMKRKLLMQKLLKIRKCRQKQKQQMLQ